jgi:hypothetical protein
LSSFRELLGALGEGARDTYLPIVDRYEEQLEARRLVAEVRETRDEAERVLVDARRAAGASGESSLALHFGAFAKAELRMADQLRALCIATLLAIAFVATALFVYQEANDLTTTGEIAKLAVTIPIAVLAAYFGREATRHRKVARRARELEIQLQTVDAFTHPLPDSLRDQIRTELGKQVFAMPRIDADDGSEPGPSVVNEAGELIEKIAELLKAVSNRTA